MAPVASGSLFTKIARGFEEWLEVGLVEGALPAFNGAQADGLLAGGHGLRGRARTSAGRSSRDTIAKSLAIGNPADGPYALELARRSGGSVESVTDEEIRDGHPAAGRDHRDLHRDRGRRDHRRARASWPSRGEIGADERVVLVITGEGLKTLDAVRGTFAVHEIEPTAASFEARCRRAARRRPVNWRPRWR